MANLKMQTPPPSPKEKLRDISSQPVLSSPSAGACPSTMSKVNRLFSSPDNSHVSTGLNGPCGSNKRDIRNQGQRDLLYTSLRALVNEVVSQLRKSSSDQVLDSNSISYGLPPSNDRSNISAIKTNPSTPVEVKTRAKTTLVGEEIVSFLLPLDCLIGTDLDKNVQKQSSFEKRLQGWHIACKQRANGKLDMTYCHGQSTRMFHSIVEVVNFIMEDLIIKETPGGSSPQEQGFASTMKGSLKRKISSSKKGKKIPPSKSLKISSAQKIVVERFLEESYNNLNNIHKCRWVAPESQEWEKYMKPSSWDDSSKNQVNQTLDENSILDQSWSILTFRIKRTLQRHHVAALMEKG